MSSRATFHKSSRTAVSNLCFQGFSSGGFARQCRQHRRVRGATLTRLTDCRPLLRPCSNLCANQASPITRTLEALFSWCDSTEPPRRLTQSIGRASAKPLSLFSVWSSCSRFLRSLDHGELEA